MIMMMKTIIIWITFWLCLCSYSSSVDYVSDITGTATEGTTTRGDGERGGEEDSSPSKAGMIFENAKPLRVFTFSLQHWNPIEGHRQYQMDIDLQHHDLIEQANVICQEISQRVTKIYDGYVKCMIPTIQSLRWKRAVFLGQAAMIYEKHPHGAVLFALDIAYESDQQRIRKGKKRKLCVLGAPLPHIVLSASMLMAFDEIIAFFPTKALQALENGVLGYLELKVAQEYGSYFNTTVHYYSLADGVDDMQRAHDIAINPHLKSKLRIVFQHQCDVIHILPDFEMVSTKHKMKKIKPSSEELEKESLQFFHYLSKQKTRKNKKDTKSVARLIWNQLHPNATAPLLNQTAEAKAQIYLKDAIDWQLSNTWFCVSFIGQVVDRNGYFQKSYHQLYPEMLMTVRMGVLYDEEEEVMKTSMDWLTQSSDRYALTTTSTTPPQDKLRLQKQLVIVITCMNRIMIDTSLGIQEKLKQLGYDSVHLVNEFNLQTATMLNTLVQQRKGVLYQISMAPSDIELYSKYYTVFNCEQGFSNLAFQAGKHRYLRVMHDATTVWTYFQRNLDYIRVLLREEADSDGNGIDASAEAVPPPPIASNEIDKVYLVPFYYTTQRGSVFAEEFQTLPSPHIFSVSEESNQWKKFVFFFGSGSMRRISRLHQIRYRINAFNEQQVTETTGIEFLPLAGSWDLVVFDYERDYYVHHAKLMLNIGLEDTSNLEVHRINYLLSFGKVIISERGQDASLVEQYQDAVIFVDSMDEMVDKILYYLDDANHEEWLLKVAQAKAFHQRMTNDLKPLEAAMLGIENILLQQGIVQIPA